MKKLLIPFLSLFLCGCSTSQIFGTPAPDFDTAYSMSADIEFGELSAVADITRNGRNDWSFAFTEPEQLSGMTFTLCDGNMTAALGELNVSMEANDVYTLIPDVIAHSIDSLTELAPEQLTRRDDGTITLNTDVNGKKVVLTSTDSGELMSLKSPFYKISIDFSEHSPIDKLETIETYDGGSIEII